METSVYQLADSPHVEQNMASKEEGGAAQPFLFLCQHGVLGRMCCKDFEMCCEDFRICSEFKMCFEEFGMCFEEFAMCCA